jgi:hypothetical protein
MEFEVWQKYPVQLFTDAAACIVMLWPELQVFTTVSVIVYTMHAPPPPTTFPPVGISSKVVLHFLRDRS